MAILLIDISDVTTQPIKGDTVTLTAPAPRPATGGGVTRPFSRLVPLRDGYATVEVDPGPLRVTFHDGYGREVVIDTRVPAVGERFTLRDLIVAEIGDVDDVPGIREALADKADKEHQHELSDVDGLQAALNGKADTDHQHTIAGVEELDYLLSTMRSDIDDKSDAEHSHELSDVDGLQAALDGKAPKSHSHTIAEIKDLIWSLDQKVSITDLEASTKRYASVKIAELVDGAPESLDTLREVAAEFKKQDKAIEAVFNEIGKRAPKSHSHSLGDVTGLQSVLDGIKRSQSDAVGATTAFQTDEGSGLLPMTSYSMPWSESSPRDVKLAAGSYLFVGHGVETVTQYNASPWSKDGDVTLPAILTFDEDKRFYCAEVGIVQITRLA